MTDVIEDSRNEFKVKLPDGLEKTVIGFLNSKDGGNIYIGVDDNGKVIGLKNNLDLLQRKIKDIIISNIEPSVLGLFDIEVLEEDNKKYIHITVARGEALYHIKGMGLTPDSCFIRVGSSTEKMTTTLINKMFRSRTKLSLKDIASPKQDLTFSQLEIYYEEKGFSINNNFLNQLELYTDDGKFNYVAYLLADNNSISILFGKYEGTNSVNLIENEDFGNCSLIKATKNILNKIKLENKIFTKIEYPERKEIKMYDMML